MTQRQLDRAVRRATGESRATIRRLGFGLDERPSDQPDDDPLPAFTRLACAQEVPLSGSDVLSLPERAECSRCAPAYPGEHPEINSLEPLVEAA